METNKIYQGDCLEVLKTFLDESVNCVVTSPPYWGLRDYGHDGQIGLENSPELYVDKLVNVFNEVKRVLRKDGTLWLNLGDCYAGSGGMGTFVYNKAKKGMKKIKQYVRNKPIKNLKQKELIGIPWRVAFALQENGWYLRSDIIWHKPNPMPESVKDRPTKSHEYIFLLTKQQKYYYDYQAILEPANYDGRKDTLYKGGEKDVSCFAHERWPNKIRGFKTKDQLLDNQHHGKDISYSRLGTNIKRHSGNYNADGRPDMSFDKDNLPGRNKRSVWTVSTKSFRDAHFAVFPPGLIVDCIKAGCPENGIVLDPFLGSGTTGEVALRLNRKFVGIELNQKYIEIANKRLSVHLHTLFNCNG